MTERTLAGLRQELQRYAVRIKKAANLLDVRFLEIGNHIEVRLEWRGGGAYMKIPKEAVNLRACQTAQRIISDALKARGV